MDINHTSKQPPLQLRPAPLPPRRHTTHLMIQRVKFLITNNNHLDQAVMFKLRCCVAGLNCFEKLLYLNSITEGIWGSLKYTIRLRESAIIKERQHSCAISTSLPLTYIYPYTLHELMPAFVLCYLLFTTILFLYYNNYSLTN